MRRLEPRPQAGTLQPTTVRMAHRWTVLLTVPIVLFSLLWISMGLQPQPVAQALGETVAYVGCSGVGQTPNFTNLPEAIETLGPDSQLNICPGEYLSGVNLSLMYEVGNIVIQRAPGTTGDVNISAVNEPAIYISETLPFTGNVTIQNINVSSQDGPAIELGEDDFCCPEDVSKIVGTVSITNVHATNAVLEGFLINATDDIHIENSTSISNEKEGFELNILPVSSTILLGQVGAAAVTTPTITLINVVADRSYQDDGIHIGSYLEYALDALGDAGADNEPLSAAALDDFKYFDLVISNTLANENGERGINVSGLGNITIQDTQAISNGLYDSYPAPWGSGIAVNSDLFLFGLPCITPAREMVFQNVTANKNLGWGVTAFGSSHNISITNTTVISNSFDGLSASNPRPFFCDAGGNVSMAGSLAEENGSAELERFEAGDAEVATQEAETKDVEITNFFGDGGFGGFRLSGSNVQVTQQNTASRNEQFGFCLVPWFGTVEIEDAKAIENGGDGVAYGFNCFGGGLFGNDAVGEEEGVGVASFLGSALYITDTTAIGNAGTGISVAVGFSDSYIENVTTAGNNIGIAVNRSQFGPTGASGTDIGASVEIDSAVPSVPQVFIQDSLIQSNEFYGVLVDQIFLNSFIDSITAAAAITPTEVVTQNIICQNGVGLGTRVSTHDLDILSDSVEAQAFFEGVLVDARGNWWGDQTGPTVPSNPGGKGDSIVTLSGDVVVPLEVVEGTVLYDPWINTFLSNAQPNPTLPGVPVDLLFQFADAGLSYYLADGLGDSNNPPIFTLSTDNGTIDGSNDVGKRIVNNQVTGTLLPDAAGVANVTLTGPCDLAQQVAVNVATPSIDIEKSPDIQGVGPNGTAVFTVTIQNTGDITLTEIAVDDPVAATCARAVGALGDLGPGESIGYTCSVTAATNLVNSAQVTARPLVGGTPAGSQVSDTDTAEVRIANLALSKTVWVDGYGPDCPTDSDIHVPISTTVQYCYTVTNTGDYTLTTHSLVDDHLGTIFTGLVRELGPGQSFSTVDAGLTITDTLFVTTTNTATWSAVVGDPVNEVNASAAQAVVEVAAQTSALVRISVDSDDQDNDGIPDNIEGTGDLDNDGIPDFLDPDTPTSSDPDEQPQQDEFLFIPSLRQP